MTLKYYFLVCLQAILLQACQAQGCKTVNASTGIITFSSGSERNFKMCWHIDVPEDNYVRLDLTENNPYCDQMYLQVTDLSKGETEKICKYYGGSQNWTKTFLSSVNMTIVLRNAWRDDTSFEMRYHIESVACAHKDSFRCSENQCIYSKQVCNGIEECKNGADENECGLQKNISGISVSRKNAVDWLKRRQTEHGWGRNTHRAITALRLTGAAEFQGKKIEEEMMVKELELKTVASLWRNETEAMSVNELSMYVNALLVTCHNPRDIFGKDLLKILANRAQSSKSPSPGAYLTLCNADWPITELDVKKLLNLLSGDITNPYVFEIQALTIMALSCIDQRAGLDFYSNDTSFYVYNKTIENFISHQNRDGSFGNAHTTAMVTQALVASGQEKNNQWRVADAVRYLMRSQNSSLDFLSVYLSLPLYRGKTLADIRSIDCSDYQRRLDEDDDVQDVMDKMSGNTRVQYSLYYGDRKNIVHTVHLKISENSTAFDVMKVAQAADSRYKFSYHTVRGSIYIYEVAGITNDMEAGKVWLLYKADSSRKPHLELYTSSPNDVSIQDNDHLVFWYKTVDV